mmetsp:Transcript_37788/g.121258  ORF Transcript_37788/g.121258 Transcript_37788/m.121258 type:complete len:274 (-) Transcript_37788:342-1163(-)
MHDILPRSREAAQVVRPFLVRSSRRSFEVQGPAATPSVALLAHVIPGWSGTLPWEAERTTGRPPGRPGRRGRPGGRGGGTTLGQPGEAVTQTGTRKAVVEPRKSWTVAPSLPSLSWSWARAASSRWAVARTRSVGVAVPTFGSRRSHFGIWAKAKGVPGTSAATVTSRGTPARRRIRGGSSGRPDLGRGSDPARRYAGGGGGGGGSGGGACLCCCCCCGCCCGCRWDPGKAAAPLVVAVLVVIEVVAPPPPKRSAPVVVVKFGPPQRKSCKFC